MFTHIVLFKLHDNEPHNLDTTRAILLSMKGQIPQLRDIEVGLDVLQTDRSFDLALITRFDSPRDYRAYRTHPYHVDPVLKHLHEVAETAVVVDYES